MTTCDWHLLEGGSLQRVLQKKVTPWIGAILPASVDWVAESIDSFGQQSLFVLLHMCSAEVPCCIAGLVILGR